MSMGGKVRSLKADKGFGFVKGDDGVERFFHRSQVIGRHNFDTMTEGQRVEFDHELSDKGPRAVNVRLVD